MIFIRTALLFLLLVFGAGATLAQNFEKGYAAYQASDYAAALKEWYPLANQGNADSQYNLGLMYRSGKGVLKDYAEAVKWYRLAAEQGLAEAQNNLASMYNNGHGVLQDYAEAVKWLRLAAKQGYAEAQNNLGHMYYFGNGVLQDNVRAHMWYNIASTNGHPKASKWRGETAVKMTSADISEAQKMARECMNSNYQDCGL
jgi:uncharacterized protein